MKDIIITGPQGSGKSEFAQKYFAKDYTLLVDMPLEEIKRLATSIRPKNGEQYVFTTQEPVDLSRGNRRFILIQMPS